MSRIFEALQRSEPSSKGGFTDLVSALPSQVEEPRVADGERNLDLDVDRDMRFAAFAARSIAVSPEGKLFCLSDRESLGAEKFRFLAVRLRQLQSTQKLKRLLITSTIPEEGKSTISANLAVTLARKPQHRVLLLEGDLRRPALGRIFGLPTLPGLTEWLQGPAEAKENIYHLPDLNCWFMPAGAPPENPLELMQSPRLGALMEQLGEWFDWVLIDSPPVLPLADTSVWAKSADGILLVAREGVTQRRQLQRGLQTLDESKLLGVVLNSSNNADHKKYYQRYGPAKTSTV